MTAPKFATGTKTPRTRFEYFTHTPTGRLVAMLISMGLMTGMLVTGAGLPQQMATQAQAAPSGTDQNNVLKVTESVTPSTLPSTGGSVTYTLTFSNPAGSGYTAWLSSGSTQYPTIDSDVCTSWSRGTGWTPSYDYYGYVNGYYLTAGATATMTCSTTLTSTTTDKTVVSGMYMQGYSSYDTSAIGLTQTVQVGSPSATPTTSTPTTAPGASGGTVRSSDGSYEVTKTASTYLLPTGGGEVTYTYKIKNLRPARTTDYSTMYSGYIYPTSTGLVSDDKCANMKYVSGMSYEPYYDYYWGIAPGATATYTCTTDVTQSTTNTAKVTAETYVSSLPTTTATATVNVQVPKITCDTQIGVRDVPGEIFTVDPATGAKSTLLDLGDNGAATIAVDPTKPSQIYYIPRYDSGQVNPNFGVWMYDSDTGTNQQVLTDNTKGSVSNRLAFNGDGVLYSWANDGTLYKLSGGAWVKVSQFTSATAPAGVTIPAGATSPNTLASGDIVFDGLGNLWLIGSDTGTKTAYLYTISAADLAAGKTTLNYVGSMGTGTFNGLSFDTKGNLYATASDGTSTGGAVYLVNKDDGSTTKKYDLNGTIVNGTVTNGVPADLASCALPKPELRITKTVDNRVVAAGGTATYTVTIENIGSLAATGVTFTDNKITGGTYVSSTLNGTAVSTAGTNYWATAQPVSDPTSSLPGQIAPGQKATIQITVKAGTTPGSDVCNQGLAGWVGAPPNGQLTDDPGTADKANDATCASVPEPKVALNKLVSIDGGKTFVEGPVDIGGAKPVTYRYEVSNTGTEPLTSVTLSDDKCPNPVLQPKDTTTGTGDTDGDGKLDLKEMWVYTCSQTISTTTTNTATAGGTGTLSKLPAPVVTDKATVNVLTPSINVTKTAGTTTTTPDANGNYVVTYTVTAKNSGQGTGTTSAITDTLGFDPNLIAKSVTVNGTAAPLSGQTFTVSPGGDALAPGATKTWTIAVTYTFKSLTATTSTCAATPTSGKGLYNSIAMTSDAIATDNAACVNPPAPYTPAISLDKAGTLNAGVVDYTFTVKNTGPVTLTNVVITDPKFQAPNPIIAISCPKTTLAPGESMTCTAKGYKPTQSEIDAGKVTNSATVTGTAPDGTKPTDPGDATVTIPPNLNATIVKSATVNGVTSSTFKKGDTIVYSFVVTNTGNVTLTNVAVADKWDSPAGRAALSTTCGSTTLVPNQSTTCTVTYVATQADVDAGKLVDHGTLTATPPTGTFPPKDSNQVTLTSTPDPKLALVKKAGTPVDVNKNGLTDAGDTIVYTFDVTNTGNVTLTNVSVDDPMLKAAGVTITCPKTTLAPTETTTCTATAYTITAADVKAGSVLNQATAHGTTPGGSDTPSNPSDTVTPVKEPVVQLVLDKTVADASGNGIAEKGEVLTYTFKVTNNSNVVMNNISISEDTFSALGAKPTVTCKDTTLAVGASTTCTATYTVTQADIDNAATTVPAQIVNTAHAVGTPAGSTTPVDSNTDDAQIPTPTTGTITLDKTVADANNDGKAQQGEVLTYSFKVTNTGKVTVSNLKVNDTLDSGFGTLSAITCPTTTLAPGESTTCTATYTVDAKDMDLTLIHNTATVSGTTPDGSTVTTPPDTAEIPPAAAPGITLEKKVASVADKNGNGITDLNDQITWTFTVTNTGNTTLNNVAVSDALLTGAGVTITCPKTTLAAGEVMQCSTTAYSITAEDVKAGKVHNVATVTGTTPQDPGTPVTPPTDPTTDTPVEPIKPGITIDKQIDSATFVAGQALHYSFVVTNTSNVPMTNVTVKDTWTKVDTTAGATLPVVCPKTSLAVGESMTCTATYTATQADVDNGRIDNSAAATGTPTGSTPITSTPDTATTTSTSDPKLSLVKTAGGVVDANGNGKQDAGDTITFSFKVTNDGNVTLTKLTVSDPMLAAAGVAITCPVTTLAPQASTTCTSKPYTITQADMDAGSVVNTAQAHGTTPTGSDTPSNESSTTTPLDPSNALSIVKSADKTTFVVGDTITYTFVVTNTGTQTISNLKVTDAFSNGGTGTMGAIDCKGVTSLAPGASTSCTMTYVANQADVDAGSLVNAAAASGTTPKGENVETPSNPVEIPTTQNPALTMTKTADKSTFTLGETVTYTFTVKNTGNVTLHNIAIVDTFTVVGTGTPSPITCKATTLEPNAETTCTMTYVTTQKDVDNGTIVNAATATGTTPGGSTVETPPSEVTVTTTQHPALAVVKKASQETYQLNDVITYTFTVTNTGDVTMNNIKVTDAFTPGYGDDSRLSPIVCPAGQLEVGKSVDCTATYTITQADVDAGKLVNTAKATGTPPGSTTPIPEVPSNEVTLTTTQTPKLTLDKTAGAIVDVNKDGVQNAGDTITFSFKVTNDGNVTMENITIDDAMLAKAGVPVTCPTGPLAPGASATCTSAAYPLTVADVDAGHVANAAIAKGTTPSTPENPEPTPTPSNEDKTDTPITPAPAITVLKTSQEATFTTAGETIHYSFLVTNTGNVTLTNVNVTDTFTTGGSGTMSAITCPDTTLAPGASTTCTATYETTQNDVDAGKLINVATAHGTQPPTEQNPTPTPTDSTPDDNTVTSTSSPALSLKKSAGAPTVDKGTNAMITDAGDQIVFTFLVKNEGNVTLSGITVDDPMLKTANVAITCDPTTLKPGESVTCTSAPYTLTQADIDAGHVANKATATGTTPSGETPKTPESPTDTPLEASPALTLDKTADTSTFEAGQTVTYSFLVTNTGNVTLTNVNVTDTFTTGGDGVASAITCKATTLAPGASTTCTMTYVATQADADKGSITNAAVAHGTQPVTPAHPTPTPTDSNEDTVTITDAPAPAISVVKTAKTDTFTVGDTITYSFKVTNDGNVTLKNIRVVDTLTPPADPAFASEVTCPVTELAPTQSTTCTMTYVAQQADVDNGAIVNSATAYGTPPTGPETPSEPSTETVTSEAKPALLLDKDASQTTFALGDTITYSFKVTNTGNVTMSNINVTDTFTTGGTGTLSAITCPVTTLKPTESTICTATYVPTQADVDLGKIVNAAVAHGTQPSTPANPEPTPTDSNTDTETVTSPATPTLEILKKASTIADTNGNGKQDAGDTITYSFEVTNTGTVTMTKVTVTDAKLGLTAAPCADEIKVGQTVTCTTTKAYVLTQADVDAGHVFNSATTQGNPPGSETPIDPSTPSTTDTPIQTKTNLEIVKKASQDTFKAGDTITYTFTVTNNGNQTIKNLVVTDTFVTGGTGEKGAIDCKGVTSLDPGASMECTMTYVANQADADLGRIVNASAVKGTTPDEKPTPEVPSNEVTITDDPAPKLEIVKAADKSTFNLNDTITYTFTVKNTGNVTMSTIVVTDTFSTGGTGAMSPITCDATTLAPNAETTCHMTYVANQADVDGGKLVNAAAVTGTTPADPSTPIPPVPSNEVELTHTPNPGLSIEKKSDATDNTFVAGQTITYTFTVANTGDVTMSNIKVTDAYSVGGTGETSAIVCAATTLAPGAQTTCSMTYVATQADADRGKLVNKAAVTGTTPQDPEKPTEPTPSNEVTLTDDPAPALTLDKVADKATFNAGDTITYTFTVTNTGNVTLHDVNVTDRFTTGGDDSKLSPITCKATELSPKATTTCTATYVATQADVDRGMLVNAAVAHGTQPVTPENPEPTPTDSNEDTAELTHTPQPRLELEKSAKLNDLNGNGKADKDETITFTFVVTNGGDVTLTDVAVNDPMLAAAGVSISCPSSTLEPTKAMTCTSSPYTVTQADVDNGRIYNVATAKGVTPGTPENPGTEVPSNPDDSVTPTDETPALELVKSAELKDLDGDAKADKDEKIVFTFTVTNTGKVTLNDVKVDDPMLAKAGVTVTCEKTTLAPGEAATCTSTGYTVTQADVDSSRVYNVATAHGTTPEKPGTPTTPGGEPGDPTPGTDVPSNPDDTRTPTDTTPKLTLVKTVDAGEDKIASLGESLVFTFVVKNDGMVTLTDVTVDDPMLAGAKVAITCPKTTLAVGEEMICTSAAYTVTQADIDAGHVANLATATGMTPEQPGTPGTPDNPPTDPVPPAEVPSNPGETDTPTPSEKGLTLAKGAVLNDGDGDNLADKDETITFSFTLTNTGDVTLKDLTVTDAKLGLTDMPVNAENCTLDPADFTGALAPKATVVCTLKTPYTVTQADVEAGKVHNVATATGTTPGGEKTPTPESPTDTPTDDIATIDLIKKADLADANGNGKADVDETITYSFQVTNTGNVTLTQVHVDDQMANGAVLEITCPKTTLAVGEQMTCDAKPYVVTQADVNRGTIDNSAVAKGTTPGNPDNPPTEVPSDPSTTTTPAEQTTGIQIVKTASLTQVGNVGDTINYTFVVTNTGTVTLTGVTVTDPMLAAASPAIEITCPATTLEPGTSMTCHADGYRATVADLDSGSVINTATATGNPPKDSGLEPPTDDDTVTLPVTPRSELKIVKSATLNDTNGNDKGDLNETITFAFVVTNNGNQTVSDITVTDPMLAAAGATITCKQTTLTPGASTTCSVAPDYVITQADVDRGVVHNVATVKGTTPGGETPETPSNPTDTPTLKNPKLELLKSAALTTDADGDAKADAGDRLTFTFTVTNTGNMTVENVTIDDPMLKAAGVTITCTPTTVKVGEFTTCTSTEYTVTQRDVDNGVVYNVATAKGTTPAVPTDPTDPHSPTTPGSEVPSNPSDTTTPTDDRPELTLVKTAALNDGDGDGKADVDETIVFGFTVTNTGNVTMKKITVNDPMLKAAKVTITCTPTVLAPGEKATCTSTPYTVTQADVEHGRVYNVATAVGTTPEKPGVPTTPGGEPGDPTPGIEVPSNPDDETVPTDDRASLSLVKNAQLKDLDGDTLADEGEKIIFTFILTNTGNVTLTDVRVDDPMLKALDLTVACPVTTLAPGATTTCTAEPYTVTSADVKAGSIKNVATAHGTTPEKPGTPTTPGGEPGDPTPGIDVPSNPDDTETPVDNKSGIALVKSAELKDRDGDHLADVDEQIIYRFVVTNTGEVTLTDVTVSDPMLEKLNLAITCPKTSLAPDERMTCEAAPYTVTQADVDRTHVDNVATAAGTTPEGEKPTSPESPTTTPTDSTPHLVLDKTASLNDGNGNGMADLNETIVFGFKVTNDGRVALHDVSVKDPILATAGVAITCPKTELAVGESMDCTSAPYTVTQADVDAGRIRNVATAAGTTPGTPGTPVESNPDETQTPVEQAPELTLDKSGTLIDGDGNGVADLGEQITYSFLVTNTGKVTLHDVKVSDPKLAAAKVTVTCPKTTLAVGESMTCTSAAYTVTSEDVDAGSVYNVAIAEGTTPDKPGVPGKPVPSNPDDVDHPTGPDTPYYPGDPTDPEPTPTPTPSEPQPKPQPQAPVEEFPDYPLARTGADLDSAGWLAAAAALMAGLVMGGKRRRD